MSYLFSCLMRAKPIIAAIGLGSNVGDRAAFIMSATRALARLPHTKLVAKGPIVRSAAVGRIGVDPGGEYLNTVVLLRTRLLPRQLLVRLLTIERGHGRIRTGVPAWSPRTLDLDLLLFGVESIHLSGLVVPHPRMHQRGFVLEPLAAIAPNLVVPLPSPVADFASRTPTVMDLLRALSAISGVQQ